MFFFLVNNNDQLNKLRNTFLKRYSMLTQINRFKRAMKSYAIWENKLFRWVLKNFHCTDYINQLLSLKQKYEHSTRLVVERTTKWHTFVNDFTLGFRNRTWVGSVLLLSDNSVSRSWIGVRTVWKSQKEKKNISQKHRHERRTFIAKYGWILYCLSTTALVSNSCTNSEFGRVLEEFSGNFPWDAPGPGVCVNPTAGT